MVDKILHNTCLWCENQVLLASSSKLPLLAATKELLRPDIKIEEKYSNWGTYYNHTSSKAAKQEIVKFSLR